MKRSQMTTLAVLIFAFGLSAEAQTTEIHDVPVSQAYEQVSSKKAAAERSRSTRVTEIDRQLRQNPNEWKLHLLREKVVFDTQIEAAGLSRNLSALARQQGAEARRDAAKLAAEKVDLSEFDSLHERLAARKTEVERALATCAMPAECGELRTKLAKVETAIERNRKAKDEAFRFVQEGRPAKIQKLLEAARNDEVTALGHSVDEAIELAEAFGALSRMEILNQDRKADELIEKHNHALAHARSSSPEEASSK